MSHPSDPTPAGATTHRAASATPVTAVAAIMLVTFCAALAHRQTRVPLPAPSDTMRHSSSLATRINPNTASVDELMTLAGVGRATAKRIVAHRTQHARSATPDAPVFKRPEDLEAVRGIGPKTVDRLRPYLSFHHRPTTGQ